MSEWRQSQSIGSDLELPRQLLAEAQALSKAALRVLQAVGDGSDIRGSLERLDRQLRRVEELERELLTRLGKRHAG